MLDSYRLDIVEKPWMSEAWILIIVIILYFKSQGTEKMIFLRNETMAIGDHEYVKISKLLLLNLTLLLEEDSILHAIFPRFSAPALVSAPP